MLNTELSVLYKNADIRDNTYQVIDEDGLLPHGDVLLTCAQLDQLPIFKVKKRYISRWKIRLKCMPFR